MAKTTGKNSAVKQSHGGAGKEDTKSSISAFLVQRDALLLILWSSSMPVQHHCAQSSTAMPPATDLKSRSERTQPNPQHIQLVFYLSHHNCIRFHF